MQYLKFECHFQVLQHALIGNCRVVYSVVYHCTQHWIKYTVLRCKKKYSRIKDLSDFESRTRRIFLIRYSTMVITEYGSFAMLCLMDSERQGQIVDYHAYAKELT